MALARGASRAFHGAVAIRGPRPAVRAPMSNRRAVTTAASNSSEIFSPQECQELMGKGYKYVDIRTPQEYQAGHVPGAVNLPLGPTLPDDLRNKYSIEEKLVIACQAGNRSTTAMQALGGAFKNAVNYKGGFSAWAAAGLPVEK